MSEKIKITMDLHADEILIALDKLNTNQQRKAFRSALRQAANILVRQTKLNLKKTLSNPSKINSPNWWNGKKLGDAIKASVWKSATGAKVHLLGVGEFRVRLLETGTDHRNTHKRLKRKPHSTGLITARYFFKSAKMQTENRVFSSMNSLLLKSIWNTWTRANKEQITDFINIIT